MVRYVLRYILYVLAWYTHSNTMFIYCERLKRSTTHLWLDNIHVLLVITRYVIETIVYRSVFVPCTVYRDTPVHRSGLIASSRTVDWVWRATVTFDGARARRRGAACHAPYVTCVWSVSCRNQWLQLVCGKWNDWCVPGSQRPALTCCKDLTCKCTLWNTNCKCRSSLFTGK